MKGILKLIPALNPDRGTQITLGNHSRVYIITEMGPNHVSVDSGLIEDKALTPVISDLSQLIIETKIGLGLKGSPIGTITFVQIPLPYYAWQSMLDKKMIGREIEFELDF